MSHTAAQPQGDLDGDAAMAREATLNPQALDAAQRKDIAFVDLGVDGAQELIDDLVAQQAQGRAIEVVTISTEENGITRITEYLQGQTDVSAIHIISHGDSQGLSLGNARLDSSTLLQHAGAISGWSSALNGSADLLLYGCDLASTSAGRQLADDLGLLTGADVAASTNLTGAVRQGGDWVLEYQHGDIETSVAPTASLQSSWDHVLVTVTFQEGVSGYTGAQDTFVDSTDASANNGADASVVMSGDGTNEEGLFRFDNIFGNGAGQIPQGSTITSASLTVYTTEDGTGNPALHRVTSMGWTEASTWNSLTSGVSLNDVEAENTADATIDVSTKNVFHTFNNLASTVQLWASGTTNNGWVVYTDGNEWTYVTSEGATANQRPKLSVTYTAPTPPAIDLDANNSSGAAGRNYTTGFTENGASVKIADTDASVTAGSNTISTSLTSMTVTITNLLDGMEESLAANTAGTSITASYDSGTGELSLTGTDTAAHYQTVLRTITYNNTSDNPTTTSRIITVVASDPYGGDSLTGTTTMSITAANDAPVITSNGGGPTASINVAENSTTVTTVTSTDPDTGASKTYSISGGADSAKFSINSSSGALTFSSAPNRESPTDVGGDNVYDVIVQVSDGSLTDTQALAITVTDVDEFDVGTVSDGNAGTNTVAENTANGSTVGLTASASDLDATTNAITYALTDSAGGRFAIHATTGVVTVLDGSLLNREAASSHSITVLATSADGSTSSQGFTINVSDVDEFDVGAVSDSNAGANTVAENAANGSSVGVTASASDGDATTNTITYTLTDSASGRFAIHATTGVVTVLDGSLLNREAASSHGITVLATSADGSTSSQIFTISVSDVDEFDVGAVSDSNGGANTVAENAANGSTVGVTASASDADATTNAITYSLTDSAGGRFAIHATTGVVTVLDGSLLDREAASSHSITVLATSADGSTSGQGFTISLSDVDEFDVGAVSDGNAGANTVAENAANGSTVGVTASASDADATTSTITYSLSDDAGGRFTIHSSTGVVTVANSTLLNHEAATSHGITVLATSADGSTSSQAFTINVSDVDEFDVGVVSDSNAGANTLAENAANGSTVGITASASDADATTNTITYSLSDNAGGRFTIHSSTGVVTVADGTLLNYEAATSHGITVLATSADGSTASQSFTIYLSDVDEFDVGAVSDSNAGANSVAENAANGSTVGITASASDLDATNNTITYSLSDDAGGRFTIHASTGVVTVLDGSLLDREAAGSHAITVVASSADGSSSSQVFTINLGDADEFDVGAVSDSHAGTNTVAENAANGSTVGVTATASDLDATNNTITYSLSDDAGGRFTIHSSTGVITVANGTLLNYEAATSHGITVLATSTDGSTASQSFTVNLSDADEFDVGAVSDSNAGGNTVAENAANGSTVGVTATASDLDATNNAITYALTDSAGGRFAIHATTGVVTVLDGSLLDREAASSHSITVLATSADGSTSSQGFTVNVSDVDEFDVGVVSDSHAGANTVAENAANGSTVGVTASASDADATTNTITYSLSDDAGGRFTIHSSTGVITVANGTLLNHEAATSHGITVLATSADGSTSSQAFTINVSDVDEFDVSAVSDNDAGPNTLAESAANGSLVGITASASDLDATTNTITYSLSDDAGGRFTIHGSTGVVTVANGTLLNYEADTSHGITVVATSADGSTANQSFTINLSEVDEFDVGAVSDSNAGANTVAENAANGSSVGVTASASDADATTNTIIYTLSDDAGGRFTIHTSTGVVTVLDGSLLDREAASSHSITVLATSADGSTSSQVFTINVNDVDEFDVGVVSDINAGANTVAENAPNGSTVGITASASDLDATTNAITYSLSDDAGGRFTIHSSTGVVTVADGTLLNHEAATSHGITVLATSADGSTASQSLTIYLSDVDEFDVGAVSDSNAGANSVAENAANGSTAGVTASASDADATTNTITYSLSNDAGGRFTIHASTGVVTVLDGSLLDREAAGSHAITVVASSADGSSSSQVFTINLGDADEFDVGAVSDSHAGANTVAENAASGSAVGVSAFASDLDATNNTITYSLSDDAGGRFTIHASTGVVTVADGTLLNHEAATSHGITVLATSADGSTASQGFTIQVSDEDEFDVGAVSDSNAGANTVAENAANGSTVAITASASDADATTNTITYALLDDAGGRFTIDGSTGVVTVLDGSLLDREAASSHDITVVATSADGSSRSQVFTIALSDVDEFDVGAISDSHAGANAVTENAANGSAVGITAVAVDADGTQNTVTYTLLDDAGGRFSIDTATGVVTVQDGSLLDREAASSHGITVLATSADGSTASLSFTVNVGDVDEFDAGPVSDSNAGANAVAENAANGSTVGITASASDLDATNHAVTYALLDDASGRFTIHASTGVVTVANGSLLDFETASSHTITVIATSIDGSASSQAFTVHLSDINEAPTLSPVATASVAENTIAVVTVAGVDTDAGTTLSYSIAGGADQARFSIDSATGALRFISAPDHELPTDIGANRIYDVVVQVSDGALMATQAIAITVTDANDAPALTSLGAASVVEHRTAVMTVTGTDADEGSTLSYSILGGADQALFGIDSTTGALAFLATPDFESPDDAGADHVYNLTVQVSDGSLSTSLAITITLTDDNDAPTLSGSHPFSSMDEDAANHGGTLVSALTAGMSTDVDSGARQGIAVMDVDQAHGTWQYTLDSGTTWQDFGAPATTRARLLAADASTAIRFVPEADWHGTATISYRAWDLSSGMAGDVTDTTFHGGATAFSTATASPALAVNPVNDAPTYMGSSDFLSITEDDTSHGGQLVSTLLSSTDVDTGSLQGLALHAQSAGNGLWQYSIDGGQSWMDVGAVSTPSALLLRSLDLLRFVPDTFNSGAASISFYAWDQTIGSAGTRADVSARGGAAAYSASGGSSSITTTAINDAPTAIAPATPQTHPHGALVFSAENGNLIAVSDVDAANASLSIVLSVSNGTLSLARTSNLSFTTGSGALDATMSFTGSLADINAALNGLVYSPSALHQGQDTLALALSDQGHSGAGGPLTASAAIQITTLAPPIQMMPPVEMQEDLTDSTPLALDRPVLSPNDTPAEITPDEDPAREQSKEGAPAAGSSASTVHDDESLTTSVRASAAADRGMGRPVIDHPAPMAWRGLRFEDMGHNQHPSTVQWLLELIQPNADLADSSTPLLTTVTFDTHALQTHPLRIEFGHDASQEASAARAIGLVTYSTGLGLTIGSVWWSARIAGLLTSLLVSTPAWHSLDPLPVLVSDDDDEEADDTSGDHFLTDRHVEGMFEALPSRDDDIPLIQ